MSEKKIVYAPEITKNEKSFFIASEANEVLYVTGEHVEGELIKDFKEFNFRNLKVSSEGQSFNAVELTGNRSSLEALRYEINVNGASLYEALMLNNKQFSITKPEYQKFRGDLGEAIFLSQLGGKKLPDSEADISLNDSLIEIKTFSNSSRTILISHSQLRAKTDKYAVEILPWKSGMTISEIAKVIVENDEFKTYLLSKYLDTVFDKIKYKISTPVLVNQLLSVPTLPDHYIDGTYKINIDSLLSQKVSL